MTHHREKHRLCLLRPFCFLPREVNFAQGLHPLRHITHDAMHKGSPLIFHPAPHYLYREEGAVRPPQLGLTPAPACPLNLVQGLPGHLEVHQVRNIHPT